MEDTERSLTRRLGEGGAPLLSVVPSAVQLGSLLTGARGRLDSCPQLYYQQRLLDRSEGI